MEMNPKNQQIEFEIFPREKKSTYSYLSGIKDDTHQETPAVHVVFSYQSVMIIFICILMSMVASFTLGVEKGKLIARYNNPIQSPASHNKIKDVQSLEPMVIQKTPNGTDSLSKETLISESDSKGQIPVLSEKEQLSPAGNYTIQVASLKTESSAKNLSESLIKKGFMAFTKPSGKYIIVLAGNFEKREEALTSLRELKKTFSDCFIRKI